MCSKILLKLIIIHLSGSLMTLANTGTCRYQ
uniref:Uncharacterized protein n=1 Tax=Setaria italica TaxID=4555 RepID=K4A4J9_SETIT